MMLHLGDQSLPAAPRHRCRAARPLCLFRLRSEMQRQSPRVPRRDRCAVCRRHRGCKSCCFIQCSYWRRRNSDRRNVRVLKASQEGAGASAGGFAAFQAQTPAPEKRDAERGAPQKAAATFDHYWQHHPRNGTACSDSNATDGGVFSTLAQSIRHQFICGSAGSAGGAAGITGTCWQEMMFRMVGSGRKHLLAGTTDEWPLAIAKRLVDRLNGGLTLMPEIDRAGWPKLALEALRRFLEFFLGPTNSRFVVVVLQDAVATVLTMIVMLLTAQVCQLLLQIFDPHKEFYQLLLLLHYFHEGIFVSGLVGLGIRYLFHLIKMSFGAR
jgi:hypothetical protein